MNSVVLIPAYQPNRSLIDLVAELSRSEVGHVVVVDDGSGPDYAEIFSAISRSVKVTVLEHAVNLGKGAALKTGINHVACRWPDAVGVVTADADGQHVPADVLRLTRTLSENPRTLVLGSRRFEGDVPLRSRIGNSATRHVLRLLTGCSLRDTQTGLRGVPREMMPRLLKLDSQGYEFELDMLILCRQGNCRIMEIDVSTVYFDRNRKSHFHPVVDSMRIYFTLLRFLVAALLTAAIDYTVFAAVHFWGAPIHLSQTAARLVAMLFNYVAVRRAVFNSGQSHAEVMPKYVLLVAVSGVISYSMIRLLMTELSLNVLVAKLIAESVVFIANFAIQRDFVFTRQRDRAGDPG